MMRKGRGFLWMAASVLLVSLAGCCSSDNPLGVREGGAGGGALGPPTVPLATAGNFIVLGGSTVTNTGLTVVTNGDVGVSPGTAITGFPPGVVNGGTLHAGGTAPEATAQSDLTIAYNDAAGRSTGPISLSGDLTGLTLAPGLYKSTSSLALSGALTLSALGNSNAVWIFQIASTLTTGPGSQVILSGGAKASNVFWQVGSSATLGTNSVFKGIIMADQSITVNTGARVDGRVLARIAAVTLDTNAITKP
jgi:hypothetical protein